MTATKQPAHISLTELRKEIAKPDPFRVALTATKTITFPDLFALESTAAESVFDALSRNATNWSAIETWLSEKDAAVLRAEKLNVRELGAVVQAAISYYEGELH